MSNWITIERTSEDGLSREAFTFEGTDRWGYFPGEVVSREVRFTSYSQYERATKKHRKWGLRRSTYTISRRVELADVKIPADVIEEAVHRMTITAVYVPTDPPQGD